MKEVAAQLEEGKHIRLSLEFDLSKLKSQLLEKEDKEIQMKVRSCVLTFWQFFCGLEGGRKWSCSENVAALVLLWSI